MANKIWLGDDTGNEGKWATAANWSPAGVPVNSDDVYFENSSQDVTADWDQSAVTLDSLSIEQSYTGKIGDDSNYLQIGATIVNIGQHTGPGTPVGSGRLKIDLGSAASTVVVHNTGSPADTNKPAVRLQANHANTTIEVRKGSGGVAVETGETTTVSKITISYVSQVNSDADVFIGPGVTLTTLEQTGGDCVLECAATTVNSSAGTLTTSGSGAITTLNAKGTTVNSSSSGTITTCNITGGTVDFTKSATARTVTTLKLESGGALKYDPNVLTITNKVDSDNPVTLTATAV
ncbi:hypothetical protein KAR91_04265 [Candidatus Pacearchaeota archaeon]|nr:hypothetical protein [Candidatus Pacearchaeota archaeon]